jgi:restriction system protein
MDPVKFKRAEKSLLARLLRSPCRISFVVVVLITLASGALLPKEYIVVGALAGFPIVVVGRIAAWKQMRALSLETAVGCARRGRDRGARQD